MAQKNPQLDNVELAIQEINQRIDSLKLDFNLYFAGEIRVPPEKDRSMLEKKIRNLIFGGKKSARINLMIQNVSSKFSVYNNMWLKRLNELETGVSTITRKKPKSFDMEAPKPKPPKGETVSVSLNSEDSFDKFFDSYAGLTANKKLDKDKVINSIKSKMISSNVIDASVRLSVEQGKLKIKIKSESEY